MKPISYILEICGWALIIFTIVWMFGPLAFNVDTIHDDPTLWDWCVRLASMLGFLLEGVIFGLIAIIIARLSRHRDARSLTATSIHMLQSARKITGKDDD